LGLFGANDDTASHGPVPNGFGGQEIGFDWVCFAAQPPFSAHKRGKLALFRMNDDIATGRTAPANFASLALVAGIFGASSLNSWLHGLVFGSGPGPLRTGTQSLAYFVFHSTNKNTACQA
jgi:hypothetical protein